MIFDAIVIGAGPAGSTCARELARAGWRVAIVEKSVFPRRKVCGEFVSAPSLSLLAKSNLGDVMAGAGPEIRDVAVYAYDRIVSGAMPRARGAMAYGRALGRDKLDTLLLAAAVEAGAQLWQPWRVRRYVRDGERVICSLERHGGADTQDLESRVVVRAHGAWDTGRISPGLPQRPASDSDFFGFKARFRSSSLPRATMPLLAFPGGYGGLVTSDSGEVSFSCCIRRDALQTARAAKSGSSAGDAVLAYVMSACRGVRQALDGATREGAWLAVGPLTPGFHARSADGIFPVGNAMAEAHPIVAEGISMAIQSGALLADRLIAATPDCADWKIVGERYDASYRKNFGARILASAAFAQLAMRPATAVAAAGLMERIPALLALGARWAGKASPLNARA